jgi:Xaa-Pro aminopeptidase
MGDWNRRQFLAGAATLAATRVLPEAAPRQRGASSEEPPPLPPPLPPEVFRDRQEKLRRGASTNMAYTANLAVGRSERLIALLVLSDGPAVLVSPYFEEARVRETVIADDVRVWREQEDPIALAAKILGKRRRVGVEGSTDFHTARRLENAAGGPLADATPLWDALRSVKSPAEQEFIRAAGVRTVMAIEGTWKRLREGMTEEEGAAILREEFTRLGTPSEGLVQFGPSSALPHGGPGGRKLAPGDIVLIDTGCRVHGYDSDITRTVSFGPPSEEMKAVYEIVSRAQRTGIEALRAGASGERVDAAARRVIEDAGYGRYFTHRLGHGLGMDGHEVPYLVLGNKRPLVAGNVETVEPGIYMPEKFGVRIEDDFAVTTKEAERLSPPRAPSLLTIGG